MLDFFLGAQVWSICRARSNSLTSVRQIISVVQGGVAAGCRLQAEVLFLRGSAMRRTKVMLSALTSAALITGVIAGRAFAWSGTPLDIHFVGYCSVVHLLLKNDKVKGKHDY